MKRIILTLIIALLSLSKISAQDSIQNKSTDYTNNPAWIKMMDDPQTNYYEAVKAYDTYWKGKEKPEWEDPMMEYYEGKVTLKQAKREQRKRAREIKEMTQQQRLEYDQMCYQCKRFEQWKRDNFPYVQEDGRILTEEERMKIDAQQREEMQRNKKN